MINDTINPMGLDLTKDLHGHVRVETRDRWTGRVVDSQEKDNLVTNAVSELILATIFETDAPSAEITPLFSKMLGGVFLFSNTLTEAASNTVIPATTKILAYAGQSANTSSANQGSYNSAESTYTSNGFTTVWDFLTSQANGTIASLARTSSSFASLCCGLVTGSSGETPFNLGNSSYLYAPIGYDSANEYLYLSAADGTRDGVALSNATIYRIKFHLSKVGLISAIPSPSSWTAIKTLTSSDGVANAFRYIYDEFDNVFLYPSGTTLHVVATDGTHTTKTLTGTSQTFSGFAVTRNYYWRGNGSTLYRITKTNTADVQTYTIGASYVLSPFGEDSVVGWGNIDGYGTGHIVYADGTQDATFQLRSIKGYSGSSSGTLLGLRSLGNSYYAPWGHGNNTPSNSNGVGRIYLNTHYLGTIANLDSPVTKTSSQTMKITYTLTEA